MTKVKLTYFKPSGKYYSEGEYNSAYTYAFDIYQEVRQLNKIANLPGLVGDWYGNILVQPDECAPALITRYIVEDTYEL